MIVLTLIGALVGALFAALTFILAFFISDAAVYQMIIAFTVSGILAVCSVWLFYRSFQLYKTNNQTVARRKSPALFIISVVGIVILIAILSVTVLPYILMEYLD